MFERLTERARKTMGLANEEALRLNHEYIGTEHILLGLLKEGSGIGVAVLKSLDLDPQRVRLEVEKRIRPGPEMPKLPKVPQSPRAREVVELAIEEARGFHHTYVGTEHLLLGLIREGRGIASEVLRDLGLTTEVVRTEVVSILEGTSEDSSNPETPTHAPASLTVVAVPTRPGWVRLADERGKSVSGPLRVELATEIVKRYNAFRDSK